MILIAQKASKEKKISVAEIAKETDAPEHFVAKILQNLSRQRLVQSVKGPNGGFYLTEDDMHTSLAKIVKAIDGEGVYMDCVLGLKACSEKNPCPVHNEYKTIKKNIIKMIENNSLIEFKNKLEKGTAFLKND